MPRERVHAIAHLRARPDKTEELRSLLTSLPELTCHEPGCIRFELPQNRETLTEFGVVSEWQVNRPCNITSAPTMLGGL